MLNSPAKYFPPALAISWSRAPQVVITQSNILCFNISRTIPLAPVEMIAATNERNREQLLSFRINRRIFTADARFLDSKPPELDIDVIVELTSPVTSE